MIYEELRLLIFNKKAYFVLFFLTFIKDKANKWEVKWEI